MRLITSLGEKSPDDVRQEYEKVLDGPVLSNIRTHMLIVVEPLEAQYSGEKDVFLC